MVPEKEAFEQRFGMRLVTGYGQTETSFVTLDTVDATRPGSCGKPHPDWEVAVVDEKDRPLPPGTVGESSRARKRAGACFPGYYRADTKTVQTLRNLWYHSGDAGVMDEDGWLYFKHRLNEAIRRRGENISAYEVENRWPEAHPDVVESAAFGVASEFTRRTSWWFASRRPGSTLDAAELLDHPRAGPRHMVPRYLEITDAPLPRTRPRRSPGASCGSAVSARGHSTGVHADPASTGARPACHPPFVREVGAYIELSCGSRRL